MRQAMLGGLMLTGCGPSDLTGTLTREGFEVQQGAVSAFRVEDCESLERCFGNNASSPYLLVSFPGPPSSPQSLPESVFEAIPGVPSDLSPQVALDPSEVLVLRGSLPPACRYVGFTPYLFGRTAADGERVSVFASLTDTLNQVGIGRQQGEVFESEVAIVVGSDEAAMAAAREALEGDGLNPTAVHDLVLPAASLRLGTESGADTLMLLGRVALFDDPSAGEAYLSEIPMTAMRLTPRSGSAPRTPALRAPRGAGVDESDLTEALDALEDAILAEVGEAVPVSVTPSALVAAAIDPERCLAETTECLGDNADTTYAVGPLAVARGDGELRLAEGESFWVIGVNHVEAGVATYANVSVYSETGRIGVLGITDDDMRGSAAVHLPNHPEADRLFAVEVARSCADRAFCHELDTSFPGVPLDEDLFFVFRAYVAPGNTVSPAHDEILTERVLHVGG